MMGTTQATSFLNNGEVKPSPTKPKTVGQSSLRTKVDDSNFKEVKINANLLARIDELVTKKT